MNYKEMTCKTALNPLKKGRLPYQYDLNIYRGCEHSCQYCFALYTHKYMNSDAYFDEIFFKKNIASILASELSKKNIDGIINIGGVCDSYQPAEVKLNLMPSILKVLIKYKKPIIISTKSNLILRDIELIKELSKHTMVNIAATITTMDEQTRSIIEPNTSTSEERFQMLERIKKETDAIVGVHIMPIIPYITDSKENLNAIYKRAHEINANYVLPGTLYLRGKTRDVFFDMIHKNFKDKESLLIQMYSYNYDRKPYKKELYTFISDLKNTYEISSNYNQFIKPYSQKKTIEQLSLF